MCVTSWTNGSTETKRVTVIERTYDEAGNLVKEVETITETETKPNYYHNPSLPYTATY